jgi:hypothetical protein
MANSNSSATNITSIIPSFAAMTPYQIYLQQVRGVTDSIRAQAAGLTYIPPQLGGLEGQLAVLEDNIVLQLIDFQVGSGSPTNTSAGTLGANNTTGTTS